MKRILSSRWRSASNTPLMPSPGIPKIVSTPQSIRVSTRISPPVFAIVFSPVLAFFVNAYVPERSAAGRSCRLRRLGRRTKDDVARDLCHIGDAGQRHGNAELVLEDVERLGDSRLSIGAEAVQIGAADEAGARAEAEELEHVEPRAHCAGDLDFGLVA